MAEQPEILAGMWGGGRASEQSLLGKIAKQAAVFLIVLTIGLAFAQVLGILSLGTVAWHFGAVVASVGDCPNPDYTLKGVSGCVNLRESPAALEQAICANISAERRAAGLSAVPCDPALSSADRGHSQDMAQHNFVSYFTANDEASGSGPPQRAQAAGVQCRTYVSVNGTSLPAVQEDIFAGYTFSAIHTLGSMELARDYYSVDGLAAAVSQAWLDDSDHRAIILAENYTIMGVGAAVTANGTVYVTQDFC